MTSVNAKRLKKIISLKNGLIEQIKTFEQMNKTIENC